jgi:hypothetical protein
MIIVMEGVEKKVDGRVPPLRMLVCGCHYTNYIYITYLQVCSNPYPE